MTPEAIADLLAEAWLRGTRRARVEALRLARRRAAGMKPRFVHASDEARHEARKASKRRWAQRARAA